MIHTAQDIAAELLAGLEGVTPGPWYMIRGFADWGLPIIHSVASTPDASFGDQELLAEIPSIQPYCLGAPQKDKDTSIRQLAVAAHIARCDPDSIRIVALAAIELSAAKVQNEALAIKVSDLTTAIGDQSQTIDNLHIRLTTARVAELEGVLEPFATVATSIIRNHLGGHVGDDDQVFVRAGDLFNARAALASKPGEPI